MRTESNTLTDAKTLFEQMCIDGTRFQAHKFISAVESYEGLREATNQGSEITPNYFALLSDVFSAFFQNKARLKQNTGESVCVQQTFGFGRSRHRQIMPNFCSSSNPAKPILARLSATHAIKNYPYSDPMKLFFLEYREVVAKTQIEFRNGK